jgi:hypothetical protein
MKYAAEILDGTVTQVIVGDPAWAAENLGGMWVGSDTKVGVGWLWDGVVLTPPPSPEPTEPFELVDPELSEG